MAKYGQKAGGGQGRGKPGGGRRNINKGPGKSTGPGFGQGGGRGKGTNRQEGLNGQKATF